jgi:cytoskeletal protein CcmA (bactofilin family)
MREADLSIAAFHPQERASAEDPLMSVLPKPTQPTAPAGTGLAMPPRPAAPASRVGTADRRTLVVGKAISLQGTVADAERLVVEGTVESQMIHAQELQIAQNGVFRGEVQVDDAEIAGVFDGTITARGSLVIRATGKVLGVARTRKLSVEEGGQISGQMEMLTNVHAPAY